MEQKHVGHFIVLILMITIGSSKAQDEECEGYQKPLYCYECQSSSASPNYCSDPFNATMLTTNVSICEGHCVKWVRQPQPGKETYIRTCSTRLKIKMMINIVCVEESRPSTGEICFCKETRCNSAVGWRVSVLVLVCALVLFNELT
uniref:UPAR/Ly6 domain-containing protein qvr n=1 Tax=Crassostrea virginica TaxID=6565 RepID=A0A8B8AJG6_CRAVI|nr:protein quiver-like [Crassostrea virginica]